jgi:hypothetical protein
MSRDIIETLASESFSMPECVDDLKSNIQLA